MKQSDKKPAQQLFAFRLAESKEKQAAPAAQWKQRDGVARAGCSGPYEREMQWPWDGDQGVWC
ncbi:hypothetical protein [Massilia sp. NR 4-1]|uniref:hypothetical protein n=1 Tax=Massilia sp. NR 4-1 TaxID=1678028 RepID=UPI00067DC466|nr:hypothetical protein [Massilia sp. NR 4-1]AKU21614.1 hypothetical protein ACZ75_09190 [Massilia sp. NR 4-1]